MQQVQKKTRTHGSLEKGLSLLSVFIPDNREMGTVEISRTFQMNRSTVSRMLTVLKRQGFLRQNPVSKKYSLGPEIYSLAEAYRNSFRSTLTQIAKPHLDQLRLTLSQTVVLEILFGDRAMVVYVTEGLGPIKISARVGDRHFLHSSAGGKCLLAFSSENFINVVLNSNLPARTSRTVTELGALQRELEEIRKRGFSFDDEGNNQGIRAFAVPVFDKEGIPVAAVLSAGPSNQVTWEQRDLFVGGLQHAAGKICRQLTGGHDGP